MIFRVAHWDTWDDRIAFWYTKGETLLYILIENVTCLHFSMQKEDILEQTNTS